LLLVKTINELFVTDKKSIYEMTERSKNTTFIESKNPTYSNEPLSYFLKYVEGISFNVKCFNLRC